MTEDEYQTRAAKVAERLASHLFEATDHLFEAAIHEACDVFVVEDTGNPMSAIVAVVTSDALELRLPTVEWTAGSHGPKRSTQLWQRLSLDEVDNDRLLRERLQAAGEARRRQWESCTHCGRDVPLEHRHQGGDHPCCHGCAGEHHSVIY